MDLIGSKSRSLRAGALSCLLVALISGGPTSARAQDAPARANPDAATGVTLTPARLDLIRGLLLGQRKDEAREQLAPVRVPPDPWQMQEIGALWAWAGDQARARAAVAGLVDSKLPEHVVARVILGDPNPYGAGVAEVDLDLLCPLATLSGYLFDMGRLDLAVEMAHDIRTRLPSCREAWMVELHALTQAQRTEDANRVIDAALKEHPDDATVLRAVANELRAAGRTREATDMLERVVRLDPKQQGVTREWLSSALRDKDERDALAAKMEERLAKDPTDQVAQLFLGVALHYFDEFERSNALLAPLEESFGHEQRLHIYRAMNDFNLGDREAALARLRSQLTRPYIDPDVFYCLAEILRDTERADAIGWLERYIQESQSSPVANSEKLGRVRDMVTALKGCTADGTVECDGPWEHPRKAMYRKMVMGYALIAVGALLVLAGLFWMVRARRRRRG
ncbi:MAG: hypothetical protein R3F39_08665 [Myxococcota bacterium]